MMLLVWRIDAGMVFIAQSASMWRIEQIFGVDGGFSLFAGTLFLSCTHYPIFLPCVCVFSPNELEK